jgi:hypothetical protein
MARVIVMTAALCALLGCGTVGIRETESTVSADSLRAKLGATHIWLVYMDRGIFRMNMDSMRTGADTVEPAKRDQALMKKLNEWQWEENRYYLFEIRHSRPYEPRAGEVRIRLTDAKGADQLDDVIFGSGHFEDLVRFMHWVVRAKRPVTTANFQADQLPLKLTVDFFKDQHREYQITPSK